MSSMYRFVKSSSSSMSDSRHSSGGAGGGVGGAGNGTNNGNSSGRRLFVQGTREGDDKDAVRDLVPNDVQDLQALHTRRHLASDVFDSSEESSKKMRTAGTKYITTRVLRKTTTVTRGEEKSVSESLLKTGETNMMEQADERSSANHRDRSYHHSSSRKRAKISDIVVGEESNVSAKDALLKWARRSTAKYPGVRVNDFTSSWKDGLAFNAIIHRNRPDLIDWRNIRSRVARERLETAFHVAEREYGVTRLLDPEDVDTHEVDEKSIITYISSLYDVFPEPPTVHPLHDSEAQQKITEYRDIASSLHLWIREKSSYMSDRNFPSTLIEMKKLAHESNRFRTEEVPPRHREKQRLQHVYRELQKHFETTGEVDIEPELHIDVIERNWNRLMMAHQERDQIIHEETKRLERMQRLAEKVHREIKRVDTRLEDLESKIKEEARRLERLHPLDAKHNVDLLEQELHVTEENVQSLFADVQALREGRYPQASDLHKRVEKLHQRWLQLRSLLHSRLIAPLSSISFPYVEEHTVTRQTKTVLESRLLDTNPYFKNLEECIEWCTKKIKQLQEAEYGSDLPGVQAELNSHLREHNSIEQFHSRCEQCINAKSNFHGDELIAYTQSLNTLQKLYTELLSLSNKRLSDLETLQDFLQSASNHLVWLNEKEEIEVTRDWSDRDLNVASIQQYYHSLMSELDRREIQFSAVQDRGESLLLQNHPASKCIESYMSSMNSQWSWILQLTLCLETHLKHAAYYQQFYKDVKEAENWLNKRDELLNTVYSQSDFTLDEGERLLKGMQELREELNQYGEVVQSLAERAQDVVPLKQRRQPVTRPIPILAICSYKQNNISIEKGEQWVLHDNSGRIKWRVSNGASGSDCNIPGVVFLIPPPDKEALEAIDRLKRQFERSLALWQRKQLRMRQNMIFSTIKVVRSWDLAQFLAMGADQRNAIRKALNEDAAKLLEEGDPSDPQLRRLRREMDEVNRLFDEFERRAREEEESKNAIRIFNEQISALQSALDDAEHKLNTRLNSPIPRDVDSLEHMVIQHKDFESSLKKLTSDVEAVQETFKSISRKTPALQAKLDKVLNQWNNLWNLSHLYTERMKCVEIVLNGLNETNHILSDFEIKLASFGEMPSELEALKTVHKELLSLQNSVSMQQPVIDQLLEDGHNTRRLVEKSRHHFHSNIHHDLDRLDNDLNKVSVRWNNICSQLVDRLRSCEAAYDLLEKFANSYQAEVKIIEDSYQKLNNLSVPKSQTIEIEPTKNLFKKVMERVPAVEQVNIDGGKFIREAKIYDLRLLHYCDWLIDKIHPSSEASIQNKKKIRLDYISGSGEAAVSHDLDVLNNRFDALVTVLYDRIRQMMSLYPEDMELADLVRTMEPKPLKTFRTEFSIYERPPVIAAVASPERLSNGFSSPHYKSSSTWDAIDHASPSKLNNNYNNGDSLITERHLGEVNMGNKSSASSNHTAPLEATPFSEIRSLRRIHRTDECIGTDGFDILAMKGIVHPETKEVLTVEEAIRLRILDVRTGKIAVNPRSKSTYISIEEAVHKKLVIPELAEKLLGPCGIMQDGRGQMSLLEAIQRELIDAERGPMERLKVISPTESIADGSTSVFTFESTPPTLEMKLSLVNLPLALYDLLCLDLVDRHSGLIFDRDTGHRCTVEEALKKRILNPSIREIVDTAADDKITICEALQRQLIVNGKFIHKLSNEVISFHEAKRRRLIIRPLSLKDCVELEVLSESRLFKSPIYCTELSLAEAVKRAVVDFDTHKSVVNTADDCLMTLAQAMQDGVITADALYVNKSTKETISIPQAVERGLLYSVSVKSVFNLAVFQSTKDQFVSFNDALNSGLVKYDNGNILYVQKNEPKSSISVLEAIDEGFIRADIWNMLGKKIGIIANGKELSVIEAVFTGHLNPKTGLPIDSISGSDIPFVDAIEQKLMTEEGVVTLKSLLAITLSTQTITRTVVTYATTVRIPAGDQKITKILPVRDIETHITPIIEMAKPGTSGQTLWTEVLGDTDDSRSHSRLLEKVGVSLSSVDVESRFKFSHSPRDEVPPTIIKKIILGESPSDEYPYKTAEVIKFVDEESSTTQLCDTSCDIEHQYTKIKKIKVGDSPSDDQNQSVIFEETNANNLENIHKSNVTKIINVGRLPNDELDIATVIDETKVVKLSPSEVDEQSPSSTVEKVGTIAIQPTNIQLPLNSNNDSSFVIQNSFSTNQLQLMPAATSSEKLSQSEEITKAGKSKKSPIKKTLIKMLKPLRMKDDVKEHSLLIEHADMPPEGWSLKDAIDKNFFDPTTGLLIIPGTDRQVSFEECIQLRIIDPTSAFVVEPIKNRKISLKKALEKQVLNCTGMYRAAPDGGGISMREALQKSLVIYRDSNDPSPTSGSPCFSVPAAVTLEPIRIQPDVIFDPETALLIFVRSNSSDEICSAVKSGKIDSSQVKIKLESGVESDLGTAIQNGSIDLNTRQYIKGSGDRIDFNDAIKAGLVTFLGYPLVAAKNINTVTSSALPKAECELKGTPLASLSSDEDECRLSLAELTRTRVTTEPKYLVSIGKAQSVSQVANIARPVLLQKMRKKRVKPKDAIPTGIIDKKTADLLESLGNIKNSDGKRLNLFEALDLTQKNLNAKVIKDPHTRDMISIKEAVSRGIVDQSTSSVELLVPIAKSLSLPNLLRQGLIKDGRIIHPETGNNLSLQEAIVCDIVDPLSKIKDPATGNILTLKDAIDTGVVGDNLDIKGDGADMNIAEANTKGDIFVEDEVDEVKLPLIAMTLPVALEKGLYDFASNSVKRPLTDELIPLQKAIDEGLIMTLPGDKNVEDAEIVFSTNTIVSPRSIVTSDTVIYHEKSNTTFTLGDAIEANLIDLETGQLKDETEGGSNQMRETLKKTLLAVVGAPVVGGSLVINMLQGDDENKTKTDTVSPKSHATDTHETGAAIDYAASAATTPSLCVKHKRDLILQDSIDGRVIDPSSVIICGADGAILTFKEVVEKYTMEPLAGKIYDAASGKMIDLLTANNRRLIVSSSSRQAMEEKYRVCDDTLSDLLAWIGEIEDRLANQDVVQEDVNQLRNQINILKLLKEEIDSQTRSVTNCLDQVRQVVATGSEYLSRDEINNLEKKGKQLRTRFDRANERTEKLLRRLTAARDELTKFKNDLTIFTTWMEKAQRTLEEKERSLSNLNRIDGSVESIRDFVSDVIAHQADLRFITMAAQKFVDESKEYLTYLNEFRTSLPKRLPHIEPISAQDSIVRNTVANVSSQYRDLLARVNALSDKLSGLGSKQKEYRDALNAAKAWLREIEPRAHKLLVEPIAADPAALEDQLGRVKALNNELVSQSRLIDSAKQALDSLIRSVGDTLSPTEIANLKTPVQDLENKYRQLCDALAEKCRDLDTALVQSQGVQDALDSLLHWLNDAENTLKNITRPASLHKERLEDQMREIRVLQADVDSHKPSVDSITLTARELINTASNPRLAKKIETKLRDVTSRYDKLLDKTIKRGDLLAQIYHSLTVFNDQATSLERWLGEALEIIPEASNNKIEDLVAQKDTLKTTLDQVIADGKALINHKDVTDTANLRDRVKALEMLWKELNQVLDDKHRNSKLRQEQLNAYEKLRDQVLKWLTSMENNANRLEPVSVEMESIKKQIEELKPIIKEHRDYGVTIDKLNDLGNSFDALNRPETPTRRRNAASPTKRLGLNSTYGGRRGSQDSLPSPSRGLGYMTASPGGSSGFGSRRSSQDGFLLDELSEVQQQLAEINNRYNLLGVRLLDRQNELDSIREELRRHLEHLKSLAQFLDKIQRLVPKESVPQTKEESDKAIKNIKSILEEIYEKQAVLESTKAGINDLLRRKPMAQGSQKLQNELQDISSRWKKLHDLCKDRIQILEDLKDFHDTHDNLLNWLNAKDRMMTVLGPISSDSRMVQSQVQQVQVLREEFRTQQPQLDHFVNIGENILSRIPDRKSPDAQRISTKVSAIQKKWNDLLSRLDERANSLGAAADTSREFDAGLTRLKDALQNISDQLDDIPHDKEPDEQLRKIQNLERQLEGQRPLLADLEAAGVALCDVISDPTSRAEIQGKLSAVNRQYNNLQKKLDNRKAEIEGLLRDGRQFESTCARSLGWLADTLGAIPERLLISADKDVLQQQVDQHEPIYRDVMNKEHEIIMLLNKGKDLLARSSQQNRTDTRNLQKELDKIQQLWDRLRRDTVDRQTRLQTCMEHCKKYYRALEAFIPWLSQAENKLDLLKPDTYKRTDVEKQLRELSLFRNDVWKHSGEFENLKTLGETFLAACDVDKELVKQELAAVKARWDKLNNELHERTQWLEDTARRLADFSENLRDLTHSVQRCEDRLASHDALGGASRDPKMLERIKNLREEALGLKKPLQSTRQTAKDLIAEASELGVGNANHLLDDVDNVTERLNDLLAKLDDRCSQLQSASTALAQYNEKIKGLSVNLSALEQELDAMKPIGRDVKTVRSQLDDINKLLKKIAHANEDVQNAVEAGERLVDSGFSADTAVTREQTEGLTRQLNRLDERARNREHDLENVLDKLLDFQQNHTNVINDIIHASEELRRLKPVGSEVEAIKSQKEEFANFRKVMVEPLSQSVYQVNKQGQGLIQSAAGGVNTSGLEKDLEKLNDKWNTLKDKLNERDRKLDIGLLQSGKFQEALAGLAKWLTDTEEMVANQKPPSADYKVVKAQLQEQKFLKKMLLDRQNSMSSLAAMGNEVAAGADANERKAIERQLRDLMQRFDNLTEGAAQRMDALEQAMLVAKQFQDKLVPILEWLDGTEKKIKDMELIPTDEEKIQQRIKEHDALHKDILRKKPALTELTEIASNLMTLVGEDEAAGVADKLQDTADRYTALVDASDNLGQLLQASRAGLRHLVLTYQDLQAWMESIDNRLNRYKVMPVHTEKLLRHLEDLADVTEEISNRQMDVDSTVDSGLELMKHISNDEAIQLKDKLDSLQRRYRDLVSRGADLLKTAQEMLPLVQQFHNSHNRLVDWMMEAETQLQVAEPREEDIARLELDIQEFRPVLENINLIGPQLCQFSPGEGAATIEGLVTRDNRRFDAIAEQIQRKAERIHLSKQRSLEVIGDIDELLDWFREVENQLRDAEPPSAEPDIIRMQLKEHRALNDDISSQKSRVRDVLSTAKKVLRESAHSEEITTIREKVEDLKDIVDIVSKLGSDRLGILEQALPLAEHFHQSHSDLSSWLDDMERQVAMLAMPALRPDLIAQQQDRNELFIQSINEHRPLVEKLNKTGEALIRLVNPEEGAKVQDILDSDNARYSALRLDLRQRQQALEKALQETSKFSDKLEGMLRALQNTAEQVSGADPISAHPPRIRDQIDENAALVEDLDKREEAFLAVKKAANDVINKAPNASDPAVKDMKRKLEKLNNLWNDVQRATSDRGHSLEEALAIAEKFWDELQAVMATLKDLQDSLNSQEPPAVRPDIIHQQQVALQEIKAEIDQTKPEVEQCRATGQQLMKVCGEPDKPEVKKHIEDLDNAWDNITALFAKREENLINAMEKAMEFHETLQGILEFLDKAEDKFANLGPLGTDIDAVKRQIAQLKQFKSEVDPHMVKVEALNRQAQELTERTSAEQAAALKEPLASVNRRWDELLRGIVERQRQLENALLRLGQFQHALSELLTWIDNTNRTLDNELKPVAGDPQLLEVELAKLKVLVNDIQAHQSSVDTLNDAGRQIIESGKGTDEASSTQDKLSTLNKKWRDLLQKTADRQLELEEALRDAQRFAAEIQDLLSWLGEVDGIIAASKPVGGLPETASEQLERFMEVYNELEENRPKVETVLAQGQEYLKKSPNPNGNLQHNLKTLKQRWDNVTARANDKKIKLEIALKEATEFHDALQAFIDWLTNAEKVLTNLKPVSRVLATILTQIEDHKAFQKDVSAHREAMLHLDKKGTHLKYFSQKQDVILIKNLLISVQHRWERVVAKSAERTRALDHGYKEAREFHDAWSNLMNWLTETEKGLDELALETSSIGNAPEKIKQRLAKHREFQRALSGKQATYDSTMRMGKALKEKAPKTDEPQLRQMMSELKEKWNTVCSKSVDRQRKLEESLLYCGQFKDALQALLDWLKRTEKELSDEGPVHGDLDTVTALIDQHKAFEQEFSNRASQLDSVKKTANELLRKANPEDAEELRKQLKEIDELWDRTSRLCERRANRLKDALRDAEELHKSVHMLLEWLSDAEMKLRFAATLPEDDQETKNQLFDHEKFMRELAEKEYEKNATIALAQRILEKAHPDAISVIKHWITIIQSRWDEVSTWAKQRQEKLQDHLRSLQDLDSLLEELLAWLQRLENQLLALEAEPLPDDIPTIERLIEEHKDFMETTAQRQQDVDTVCKAKQAPLVADRKGATKKSTTNLKASRDNLHDKHGSRTNLGIKAKPDDLPHYGPRFPPKGSKASEPTFRNARCKQLYDKWRNVWLLAWERQRRLQEKLDYLREVEKVRNFSWDDWRKRFLKFMNHKKSRLTDLFRKMDKNNDGLIPRDDFIDGIMKTKFDTSKLEMNAVADMFDHDGVGFIDWKEFIAALRPDWEEKQPPSEAEKIHDEVKRLVMLCTCRQKFRVFQVGEGKYRFGDSQKLRLVRILRSTVMVRVGGGWVALDEFLVKNDPCRVEMLPMPNPYIPEEHEPWCPYSLIQIMSKGRTNIELREQFILADGVSQSMSAFKPKHSTASEKQKSVNLNSSTGPITKIRERTTRSVPLGKTVNRNIGTPDSLSDNESAPYTRTPIRKAATHTYKSGSLPGSRGNSRPASRQGSKPPSRHGSNLSLDSTDDSTPSRIPRRSTSSSKSSGLSSRKPVWNESLSSNTRSPSGLASPVSDARSGAVIHRASSIPTLSGINSRLKTPSGSSTPASSGSKLTRKSSAASDSSRKSSKTPTPTDLRAPFRL